MPEPNGRDLLAEWRHVMDSVISSATSARGRSELPGELLRASRRQLELVGELVDSEQRLRGTVLGGLFGPVEAFFDLLEETGATVRKQAEALESAGRAMQESAALMRVQAELFERAVRTLRQPADLAKSATGAAARTRRAGAPAEAKAKPAAAKARKTPAKAPAKTRAKTPKTR